MRPFSIRLHADTLLHIDKAAKKAGVRRGAMIRRTLEQTFDGTPHNPLGVIARAGFYNSLCEAVAVMCIHGDTMTSIQQKIIKKKAEEVRGELEIDHEY